MDNSPMGGGMDGSGSSSPARPKHVPIDDPLLNASKALFGGVKRLGSGLLGAVTGKEPEADGKDPYAVGEENTFYYDNVQKRWRQKGDTSEVDVSNLDPMTGRPKLPAVAEPPPPPPPMGMGGPPKAGGPTGLNRKGSALGSLYVTQGALGGGGMQ